MPTTTLGRESSYLMEENTQQPHFSLYARALLILLAALKCHCIRDEGYRDHHSAVTRARSVVAFATPRGGSACGRRMYPSRHTFSTVHCNLFFNGPSKRPRKGSWKVPEASLNELSEATISFPHRIDLIYKGNNASEEESKHITVRNLELADLSTVVPMCVREFGTGDSITSLDDIPWEELMNNPSSVHDLSDRFFFGPFVRWALEMKIQRQRSGDSHRRNVKPDDNVLCLERDGRVVAIVELSMQPPDAQRNPPPVPLPMIFKELVSTVHGLPPPDGWVTNLLVDDAYRGLGYSKVLMKAVEGLAKSWDCSAIYLHVDADTVSGKVAQDLYRGLGYKPVMDQRSTKKYDWIGPELMSLGLYVVDGVPLLFLRKNLSKTRAGL